MSFYRDFNDKLAIERWNTHQREPFQTIKVRQLSPTVGAEISGIDLSKEVSETQFAEIRRALDENLAVIFRDQKLSPEDHKRFARRFGKSLHRHELAATRLRAMVRSIRNSCHGRPAGTRASLPAMAGIPTCPAIPVRSPIRCCG
ncbi:TauD/TfdA dioxygenase family protein [Bradyrhizobium campsiandrae]|uniref:TauD/TfdA dioxygenase family protein n=1 Tax=Bradyrhizobium campsiandrae TaxID=1729892 RepID=UPI0024BF20BA|nr:TauD/TfdA family dioxygenase [Bradyrhizobium campsiandrae]